MPRNVRNAYLQKAQQNNKKKRKKQQQQQEERQERSRRNERSGAAKKSGAQKNARSSAKSAVNTVKTAAKNNAKSAEKNKDKTARTSWGQVVNRTVDTQKNRDQARKDLASGFNARTVGSKNKNGKWKVNDYVSKQGGTATGKSATAYNKYKTAKENRYKAGKKTVQTKSPITIGVETVADTVKGVTEDTRYASQWYDKNEKKAQKKGMTYGDKKKFIESYVRGSASANINNYYKQNKESGKYTYTKSPTDSNEFFQNAVASTPSLAYGKTKVETGTPVYVRNKDGSLKYDKNGDPILKKDKNGNQVYEKVDTTIGNNILNARAGGFDENGRLVSQEGSLKVGSQTAGALRDAKFFGGLLQGSGYGDITKGLGQYSNAAARDLDRTTQSGAFNVGYGAGIMAQFGMSGINSMGKALLKEGLKSAPKTIAKTAGLSAALDTPLNVADAVKMGTDAKGNINAGSVAMYMGINTLMSGLMPAGIEGIGAGITHSQSKELLKLLAKEESLVSAGRALSPEDALRRDALFAKQARTAEGQVSAAGVIAGKTLDDIAGKGGNQTVNAIRAKVQVNPKASLEKISSDNPASVDDLLTIGAVKDISRKRGDFKTAAEAELKLRKMRDSIDPEIKKQVDAMMKQVDSTRKIEKANILKDADAESIVAKAKDGETVTSKTLEELDGAVEYAKQTGNKNLESQAKQALKEAQTENKKFIEDINKRYKKLGDKLNIPIKASTKGELDNVLRANNINVPDGEYGGFVLRDAKTNAVKEIYVNADAPDAVAFTVGHEVAHVMEAAGDDYMVFRDMLKEFDGGRIWDEESAKCVNLYAGVENASIEREATANCLGRILTSEGGESFLDNVFRQDRTLFEKLYDFIRKLLNGGGETKELGKIESQMRKILDEQGDNVLRDEEFGDGLVDFAMRDGITDQGFYSKTRVAVEKLGKNAKVQEDDFIKYLKKAKNGVSDEEIKWLGIRTAFEQNNGNPMTKQELLDWIDANRLVLKEKKRVSNMDNGIMDWLAGSSPTKWGSYRLNGGENYREYEYILPDSNYTNDAMSVHWSGDTGVVLHTRAQDFTTGEVASSAEGATPVSAQEAKRMANDAIDGMYDTIDTMELALNGNGYDMHEFYVDGQRLDGLYATIQRLGSEDGGGDYVVRVFNDQNGTTYEKIVSESEYMSSYDDVFGISPFVEEYLQNSKSKISTGRKGEKRVLFVDEIQSDWHNAGQKNGYGKQASSIETVADRVSTDSEGTLKLWSELKQLGLNEELGRQNTYHFDLSGGGGVYATPSGRLAIVTGYDVDDIIRKDLGRLPTQEDLRNFVLENDGNINIGGAVPDAPYRTSYTDYAMKRMLLEAIQNDQEYIAWTTAKQQAERWSDEYMKGYEIEYDQEIPSFMSKYCKQWGADVDKVTLAENGEEVWAVHINDAMKKSVLEKGQADFMMIGTSAQEGVAGIRKTNPTTGKLTKDTIKLSYDALDNPRTGAKAVLKRKIESAINKGASREELARIHDDVRKKTGWVMGADGNWEFEINDSPARFGFKLTPRSKKYGDVRGELANVELELSDPKTSQKRAKELLQRKKDLDHAWGTHDLYTEDGALLKDFLTHPELFKAYPSFKNDRVKMKFNVGKIKISRNSKGEITGVSAVGDNDSYFGQHFKGTLSLNANILNVPKGESITDYARALRVEAARRYGMEIPRPEDFEGFTKKDLLEICEEKGVQIKGKVKRNGKTITLNKQTANADDLIKLLSVKDEDVPQEFLRGTVLHEIQHKIQKKEGWAGGGTQALWQKKQRLYDDKGNVVKEYFANDLSIAKDPLNQKALEKNRMKMRNSLAEYGDLAITEGADVDSNTLKYIEYTIGKTYPEQVRKMLDSGNADDYVQLMMDEMPSVCMREMLIPDNGILPPETQALDKAMRKYFKDSFNTRKYAASSDDVYNGLIGEQQSRMTQKRSRMTPKERAETSPIDPDAIYRYGDVEAQGQPVPVDNKLYQTTFNKKYPNTRIDESGKIDYERVGGNPKKASFSILDSSDKVKAQREARAKEQSNTVKRIRETVASEAKKASQYGKDKTKYPAREEAIVEAFNKAYDERTGEIKWSEMYKSLAEDPHFSKKGANSIRNRIRKKVEEQTVTVTRPETPRKTVESPDQFRPDVEETRVPENEMTDEEFFRGIETPPEEYAETPDVNWNEAKTADEMRLDNYKKALENADTDEERQAINDAISALETKTQGEPAKKTTKAKQKPKPKKQTPSQAQDKMEKANASLDRQMELYAEAEDALAKAKNPEEKRLAQRRLGLAKGRVQKASNAIDALNGEAPKKPTPQKPKATAEVTPLPKGEKPPEKPSSKAGEIKEEMPSIEQALENAKNGYISAHEVGQHAERLGKTWSSELEATDTAFKQAVKKGELGKKVARGETYEEAYKKAQADIEKDFGKVYDRVMGRDPYIVETTQSAAEKHALLSELITRAGAGDENATLMHLKVIDKMDEAASLGGHMLQLQSYVLRNSPEGRLRWTMREINRLNKEYEKHLKGKKIALGEEWIRKIMNAESDAEIAKVMEDVGKEIWKQIPSGFFEAANQIRHFSMLFNPKTHGRNIIGNSVFLGARTMSDAIEVGMTKAFGKRIESLSGVSELESLVKKLEADVKSASTPEEKKTAQTKLKLMRTTLKEAKSDSNSPMRQVLASGEVDGCKKVLDERFEADYATNGGQNTGRWQEGRRSAGYLYERSGNAAKDTVAKGVNKAIDLNYNLLDREDRWFFKPAYRRAYVRWCKSRGITETVNGTKMVTPNALENMTKTQRQEATAWAMQQAKIATFRDDSAVSERIIKWKQATEGKKGTGLGTVGYRLLNVGLESVLPFVKTPVNILRRGMDYSPIGLFRGVADAVLAKDPQTFMRGIHSMSTGLTGSGIFVLGMWAANHDWVTVHAGEVSGDEYYDRDMGYQDFSINIFGHSVSLDWMAPVQFSFFQGAAVWKDLSDRGISMETALNALEAGVMPMMEMSFMSSAKDTVTSFMERAYRDGTGKEANAAQAIGRTLFGTLPQDWLSGFAPQLMSQTAGFLDDKQRDTSSTKEDELARSWEAFGRKMKNRIPWLRDDLEAKVNRKGEEVTNEGNLMMKFFNAFANPSNVKKITLDKYDQAIIDVLGDPDIDDKTKEYIGLDLTGNPSFDRGEGYARMTYKEKHDYLLEKRSKQWGYWKEAVDSKSFKDMTMTMRADEISDYHFISTIDADLKVYKAKYAKDKIVAKGDDEAELWKNMKYFGGKNITARDFCEAYKAVELMGARTHNSSDYHGKALAIEAMNTTAQKKDIIEKSYDVWGDKVEPAKTFIKKCGGNVTKAIKEYSDASRSGVSICEKNEVSTSKKNMSLALANVEGGVKERTYRAMGYDWNAAQAGGGLKKYGYTYDSLAQMKADALMRFDEDHNNSLKKAETIAYLESLGIEDNDELACLFEYLKTSSNTKNPYGTILDHLEWGSEPDSYGSGGRGWGRGRGRRGRGGGGGGSGGGAEWYAWLKAQGLAQASKAGGGSRGGGSRTGGNQIKVSDNTSKSALNEAYRAKLRKNIKATRKPN